ncbi:MAG: gfo/Idh/MocA family oxidoreductase [Candidatus Neomarinimicrobiota bacterium]|nr:MAG: gfo/Idh/MocA family oxidoreductase [Candidatus Neomarinimicrobiota bacterium]
MNKSHVAIGVVGVGHLGQHHVKHLSALAGVSLIGIYDQDLSRARTVAERHGTRVFSSLTALLQDVEAVSIVTPTSAHADVARECIRAGKHVFIEKPITSTVAEADELLRLADEYRVQIQVGHIERVNPALLPLQSFDLKPKYIEVQRLAPYTARGTDVPVVLDLMIHDLDILLALVNSPVKNIRASGVSIMTESVDIANARIRFQNGTVASLTSSRIAKDKVRKIKIFQKDLYITIDFLLGLTEVYRVLDVDMSDPQALATAEFVRNGSARKIVYEKPPVPAADALQIELANFVQVVRGAASPIVDGKAGRDALDIATRIHDMILEDLL